jgi:hypothetical protein
MTNPQASPARIPALDGWRGVAIPISVFLLACGVLIARRPDAVLHAQFFAEDGACWFSNAYNLGWSHALFLTYGGYLQTLPRLVASIALLVPLALAPLILNIAAIAIQALPVNILLSTRSSGWGDLRFRAMLAVLYLVLPNTREIIAGITESQWVLALCAFLLLVAARPQSRAAKAFDATIFLLSGLTGPFCILLLPIAIFLAWQRRLRISPLIIIAASSLIQGIELLAHLGSRGAVSLGWNLEWFIRLLGGQVYLATIFGASPIASVSAPYLLLFFVCVAAVGTLLIWRSFKESSENMRLFLVFAVTSFMFSLAAPLALPPKGETTWQLLAATTGIHYWFLPTLAFAWSLLWCVRSQSESARIVSRVLLFLMCFGIIRDLRQPPFVDEHFTIYAHRVEAASPGTEIIIPENPRGWKMQLVKR